MASKHLEEETVLRIFKVDDEVQPVYDCVSCKIMFVFHSISDSPQDARLQSMEQGNHPRFCPSCGRRACVR